MSCPQVRVGAREDHRIAPAATLTSRSFFAVDRESSAPLHSFISMAALCIDMGLTHVVFVSSSDYCPMPTL